MGSGESTASGRPGAVDSRLPTPDSPLPVFHPRLPVLADGNARLGENDAGVGKGSGVRCIAPFARCVASHSAKRDSMRPFDAVWLDPALNAFRRKWRELWGVRSEPADGAHAPTYLCRRVARAEMAWGAPTNGAFR